MNPSTARREKEKTMAGIRNFKLKALMACALTALAIISVPKGVHAAPEGPPIKKGIDVSYHNGRIDWKKVAAAGVDFAYIRAGSFKSGLDKQFEANIIGAEAAGVPVGIYVYSYAEDVETAKSEGRFAVSCAKDRPIAYPIAFDLEGIEHTSMTPEELQGLLNAFCDEVEAAGYRSIVYSSKHWFENKIGPIGRDKWVAQYSDACTYGGDYSFWQATSKGKVDGIEGNVDIDYQYRDYSAEINCDGVREIGERRFLVSGYRIQYGWSSWNSRRYYSDLLTGELQTGLVKTYDGTYLFGPDGAMQIGRTMINGKECEFDKKTGRLVGEDS